MIVVVSIIVANQTFIVRKADRFCKISSTYPLVTIIIVIAFEVTKLAAGRDTELEVKEVFESHTAIVIIATVTSVTIKSIN